MRLKLVVLYNNNNNNDDEDDWQITNCMLSDRMTFAGQNVNDYNIYKKAVLPQGNRAMPQVFFSVEVRQQHSLQV